MSDGTMNPEYVKDALRFGSKSPFSNADGSAFNLKHENEFPAGEVLTDGVGNIVRMPLLRGKPCFGRPERYVRGNLPGNTWTDDEGQRRWYRTRCNECRKRTPGVFQACGNVASERIETALKVKKAFDAWMDACEGYFGSICYVGTRGKLWHAFLQAIIDHGGWDSKFNEVSVKLDAMQREADARERRNESRKASRRRRNAARRGTPHLISDEFLEAVKAERDRCASQVKDWVDSSAAGRSLRMLTDESCDRIADVWLAEEELKRMAAKITNRAVAEHMKAKGMNRGLEVGSLTSRVQEDRKRIAGWQNAGLWPQWSYQEPMDRPGDRNAPAADDSDFI